MPFSKVLYHHCSGIEVPEGPLVAGGQVSATINPIFY
jgi:hypothetical protein